MGKETAENLTTLIGNKIDTELESKTQHLATKEDLAKSVGELGSKISDTKSEIMRWMFIFWVGQMLATTSLIFLYIKN